MVKLSRIIGFTSSVFIAWEFCSEGLFFIYVLINYVPDVKLQQG
jgi:hypothetical protein